MRTDDLHLEPNPSATPRVGLALSGGAARGMAHIGVLQAFEEARIPVDYIAGTSAGALIGGSYAAGLSLAEIVKNAATARWRNVGSMTLSLQGLQSNAKMETYLRELLPVRRIEDCRIPFAAVATDLQTGEAVILNKGALAFAIRASCTLPGLYVPVKDKRGRQLIDGGMVANIPAYEVRAMGAEKVIAVDVNAEGATFFGAPRTALGILFQSLMYAQRSMAQHQTRAADVVIAPKIGHLRWDEMGRSAEFIELGYKAARAALDDVRALLETAPTTRAQALSLRPAASLTDELAAAEN